MRALLALALLCGLPPTGGRRSKRGSKAAAAPTFTQLVDTLVDRAHPTPPRRCCCALLRRLACLPS